MVEIAQIADFAVAGGLVVSTFTLFIVGVDFYLTYIKSKRSDVEMVQTEDGEHIWGSTTKFKISLNRKFSNDGQRDGYVSGSGISYIELREDGDKKSYSGAQLEPFEIEIEQVDESRIPPKSVIAGRITITLLDQPEFAHKLASATEYKICVTLLVSDNEGTYSVECIGGGEPPEFSWA